MYLWILQTIFEMFYRRSRFSFSPRYIVCISTSYNISGLSLSFEKETKKKKNPKCFLLWKCSSLKTETSSRKLCYEFSLEQTYSFSSLSLWTGQSRRTLPGKKRWKHSSLMFLTDAIIKHQRLWQYKLDPLQVLLSLAITVRRVEFITLKYAHWLLY